MNLKQSVNLLLIALFVWAFQSSAIHHHHNEIEQCNLCHTVEQLELSHHNNSSTIIVNENLAVKVREQVEKVVVNSRFDYTILSRLTPINILEDRQYCVEPISLGFNATAPPVYFS